MDGLGPRLRRTPELFSRSRGHVSSLARARLFAALSTLLWLSGPGATLAETPETEFLSVRPLKASVRKEPDSASERLWIIWKYSPVEVVSYRGDWVRVKDFEGDSGWLKRSELSADPTTAVKSKEGRLRKDPGDKSKVLWMLERGYSMRVFGSSGPWVEVSDLESVSGWIHEADLWGAPPPSAPSR